jgi:hypothetical protein
MVNSAILMGALFIVGVVDSVIRRTLEATCFPLFNAVAVAHFIYCNMEAC